MLGTLFGVFGYSGSFGATILTSGQRLFSSILARGLLDLLGDYASEDNGGIFIHRGHEGQLYGVKTYRGARVAIYGGTSGLTIATGQGAQGFMLARGFVYVSCYILKEGRRQVGSGAIFASLCSIGLVYLLFG